MNNENDFLSQVIISQETKRIIRKNYQVTRLLLALAFCLFIINIFLLIPFLDIYKLDRSKYSTGYFLYLFIFNPFVQLCLTIINVIAYFILNKAYKKFITGINNSDSNAFNIGFKIFYRMNILALILLIITITNSLFGLFIQNNK